MRPRVYARAQSNFNGTVRSAFYILSTRTPSNNCASTSTVPLLQPPVIPWIAGSPRLPSVEHFSSLSLRTLWPKLCECQCATSKIPYGSQDCCQLPVARPHFDTPDSERLPWYWNTAARARSEHPKKLRGVLGFPFTRRLGTLPPPPKKVPSRRQHTYVYIYIYIYIYIDRYAHTCVYIYIYIYSMYNACIV